MVVLMMIVLEPLGMLLTAIAKMVLFEHEFVINDVESNRPHLISLCMIISDY